MSKFTKGALLTLVCLLVITVTANASEWVVDPNGNPATEFLDLTTALSTLAGYAGTHNIVVREGNYSDAGLSVPANITSIVGDGSDIVIFTGNGSADFIDISAAPSGFELSGMTINGYARGVLSLGGIGALVQNNVFTGNNYGAVFNGASSGNTITANCFYASGTANGYDDDGNTWADNYFDDYTSATSYALAGGGGNADNSPRVLNNSAFVDPAAVEFGATFTADIMWSVPDCEQTRDLGAYNFTVTYNAAKVTFVSAEYDYDFFGADGGDALYPGIDGNTPGQVTFAASNFTTPVTESGRIGTVTFTADVANTSMQINIASDYRDGNNDPLAVGNTTFIITLVDVTPPVLSVTPLMDDDNNALTLGTPINDPISGFDTYSDGSTAGVEPKILMYVDMSGTDDYDLDRVEFSWDGAPFATWGTYGSLSGQTFAVVAPEYINNSTRTEANHNLSLRLVDAAGLMSSVWSYDFDIDRTGPVLTSITMSDDDLCAPDPEYTNHPTVDVALVDDGSAVKMEFYQTGWEGLIAYNAAPQYPLTGPDGPKTLYMRLYDLYNNMGNQVSDAINLDQTAPVPTGFVLAGGAASTSVAAITGMVGFYGGSGAFELNFSEDADDLVCGNGGWTSLVNPVNVTLSSPPDGMKEVFYATRDRAGNISAPISDDIELDMTPPAAPTLVVSDPDATVCSDNWTVDVEVSWTDGDVVWVGLGMTSGSPTDWHDVSALTSPQTFSFTITGGTCDADNTIYGEVWDEVSQISPVASGSIFVDCSAPTGLGVTVLDQDYPSVDPVIHINWSNDATVDLSLTGVAADAVTLYVSEDGVIFTPFDISADQPFATSPYVFEYTHSAPVEQANNVISVYVEDCAGRVSATVTDGIYFDLPGASPPEVVAFSVSSADPTNVLSADLAIDGTDDYYSGGLPWKMQIWEDGFQGTGTGWIAYSASYATLALDGGLGDGTRTINLLLSDRAGNVSDMGTTTVAVDQTPPSGTVNVVSTNLLSAAEWTNIAACNLTVGWDLDVVKYRVRNRIAGTWTMVDPAVATMPWSIDYVYGWNYVELRFYDNAGNQGPIVYDSIFADGSIPAPPTTFTASPTGSALLEWSANPNDQYYLIKYNYNGDYPAYALPNPPAPTMATGFPASGPIQVWGTEHPFDGPHPDIYIFSIWVVNKAGTMSSAFTASNLSTNYLLGDFTGGSSPDGCLSFDPEFFALAMAYGSTGYGGFYDPLVDIAPTDDGTQLGIPMPDGDIDFDDFVLFALNYRDFRCGAATEHEVHGPAKLVTSDMRLIASAPESVVAGEEVSIPITLNNASGIVGYHIVFDYDVENFEVVGVEPGAIYSSLEESFFLYDKNAEGIELVSVALGSEFEGDELALITLRAINDTPVELTVKSMDIRDWNNKGLEVEFGMNLAKVEGLLPKEFALSQNYPNPFNPSTVIELSLPVAGDYSLEIYNIAGQLVEEFHGASEAGIITVEWDASAYSSGIYLYRMVAGQFTETKKMVMLK